MSSICRAEKWSILEARRLINKGRENNKIVAIVPRQDQIQGFSITPALYDFAFRLVPRLTVQLDP